MPRPVPANTALARWFQRFALIAACLLAAGCSGIEPMALPDERENPSFPGLFTGDDGAWVVYRKEE